MHRFVYFDNEIIDANNARLYAASSAALYGRGVFTTVAVYEKKAFLWEKHWKRLNDNARKIGLNVSEFSEDFFKTALDDLIEKNALTDARARITLFDAGANHIWNFGAEKKTSLLITTAERRVAPSNLRLTVSPFPINSHSPLAGVKSCSYLENLLALEDARAQGFDEAVRVNERGEIVSACMANVFWYERGGAELFTPSLRTGCLPGTTREFVIENHAVREIEKNVTDFLRDAESVFLTSAGIGIAPVSACGEQIKFARPKRELIDLLPAARSGR